MIVDVDVDLVGDGDGDEDPSTWRPGVVVAFQRSNVAVADKVNVNVNVNAWDHAGALLAPTPR